VRYNVASIKIQKRGIAMVGFSASTRQNGGVTIVDVRGRFTLMEGQALHDLLADLFREGHRKVVLNFAEVSYLDSSGIGQLVRALYSAQRQDAELRIIEFNGRVRDVLKLTNLHEMLPDYPNEDAALSSFSSGNCD
jgi:anti-sigma B factor antagonist